jgi:hypothetical protein
MIAATSMTVAARLTPPHPPVIGVWNVPGDGAQSTVIPNLVVAGALTPLFSRHEGRRGGAPTGPSQPSLLPQRAPRHAMPPRGASGRPVPPRPTISL